MFTYRKSKVTGSSHGLGESQHTVLVTYAGVQPLGSITKVVHKTYSEVPEGIKVEVDTFYVTVPESGGQQYEGLKLPTQGAAAEALLSLFESVHGI